ncbi:phosphoserine phosphatase, partial [Candidatus Gottesmanbacteria bacterium]|nr:phosphoserine phosphatase [Candidatus Gottesmanbacteria bacterium]
MKKQYYIFDADSTLLRIETLEELAKITLRGNSDAKKILDSIEEITLL